MKSPPSPSSNPYPVPFPSPTTRALDGVTKDGAGVIVEGIDVDVVEDVDADTDAGKPVLEDSPVVVRLEIALSLEVVFGNVSK